MVGTEYVEGLKNTGLAIIASANSRFSLPFSASRPRSFWASESSMPPYFAFHPYRLALDIPCLRHWSAVGAPASCSHRMVMICSSENRFRFIVQLLSGDLPPENWTSLS